MIDPAHTHTDAQVDIDTATDVLPPYLEVVYCQSPDLAIDSGLIGMFDDSAPSGWTRFSALDGAFARSAASYGGTGGSNIHTHVVTITTGGPSVTGGSKAIGQTSNSLLQIAAKQRYGIGAGQALNGLASGVGSGIVTHFIYKEKVMMK